jgi:hypothetical protein
VLQLAQLVTETHLRGHVVQCAAPAEGQLLVKAYGQAKVTQPELAQACEEDVFWLDVTVQHHHAVHLLKDAQQGRDDLRRSTHVCHAQTLLQKLAAHAQQRCRLWCTPGTTAEAFAGPRPKLTGKHWQQEGLFVMNPSRSCRLQEGRNHKAK